MKASECSFDEMRVYASSIPNLAAVVSFMQVEFGLLDLESSWAGFVDTADDSGTKFNDKQHICRTYGELLRGFLSYQSVFVSVGLPISEDSHGDRIVE